MLPPGPGSQRSALQGWAGGRGPKMVKIPRCCLHSPLGGLSSRRETSCLKKEGANHTVVKWLIQGQGRIGTRQNK